MLSRDWQLRIQDVLQAIAKIERYRHGMDFRAFAADDRTVDAVLRNLEILGEAVRPLPAEVIDRFPQIPWEKMRAIRHVLVHQYFGVSLPIVWQTITEDLPPLVPLLRAVLAAEDDGQ